MSNNSPDDHAWIDWSRLFRNTRPFDKDVFNYIEGPISFYNNEDELLYVNIVETKLVKNQFGWEELRLRFHISSEDESHGTQESYSTRRPYVSESLGQRHTTYAPLFGYTFNSQLTLGENKRRLKDFVLSHYRQAAVSPRIQPKRLPS